MVAIAIFNVSAMRQINWEGLTKGKEPKSQFEEEK